MARITANEYLNYFSCGSLPADIPVPTSGSTGGLGLVKEHPPAVIPDYRHDLGTDYARTVRELEHQRLLKAEKEVGDDVGADDDVCSVSQATVAMNRLEVDTYADSLPATAAHGTDAVPDNIYDRFNFEFRDSSVVLPIQRHRDTITRSVHACDVVVIEGHTGCGKTTQVPQFLLDDCRRRGVPANIVVTQPRRIAAVSVARRVARERNWTLGSLVGYEIGLDKCVGPDTRLTFCTTGVLLQKLVHRRTLAPYTHVLLDEVHERNTDTDFALLLVRRLQRMRCHRVKVVLMSATFETRLFADYFCRAVQGKLEPACVIDVGGRGFHQVNVHYIDELAPLVREEVRSAQAASVSVVGGGRMLGNGDRQWNSFNLDTPRIHPLLYSVVSRLIKQLDSIEIAGGQPSDRLPQFARSRGSVLVFLPGMSEIQEMLSVLSRDRVALHWRLLPLHSVITNHEQAAVFDKVAADQRKIILSTNLAESSITVADVKYVVDFCLTRQLELDPTSGYPTLRLVWASRASCRQRAGRTGRVGSGRVYRLVSSDFFHHHLADYCVPEMLRSPLETVVVRAKKFCVDLSPSDTLALSLSPPDLQRIWLAVLRLKQMGALIDPVDHVHKSDEATACRRPQLDYDGELTVLGHVVAAVPVDARLARLLALGHAYGCMSECLTVAAGLTSKSVFARPFHDRLNGYRAKLDWSGDTFSDCVAIVRAYSVWDSHMRDGHFERGMARGEKQWADSHSIQLRCMHELADLRRELEQRLDDHNIRASGGGLISRQLPHQQLLVLQVCLAGAFYPNLLVCEPDPQRDADAERAVKGHNPLTTVHLSGLPHEQHCSVLYYGQLMRQLRPLLSSGHTTLPLPTVHFDSSHAYIDFGACRSGVGDSRTPMTGSVPTAVYLALRLGQLPACRFKIHRYSSDEEAVRIDEYRRLETKLRWADAASDLTACSDQVVGRYGVPSTRGTSASSRCKLPGSSVRSLSVVVTYVQDPSHFYVRYDTTQCAGEFEALHATIQKWSGSCRPASQLHIGQVYLVPFSESGSVAHYRARLDAIHKPTINDDNNSHRSRTPASRSQVLVFFIDFGNAELCDSASLLELCAELQDSCLTRMDAMAVPCQLSEVQPPQLSDGRWSDDTAAKFRHWTLYKSGMARVFSVLHGVIHMELLIEDDCLATPAEFSVNRRLVQLGVADEAVESQASRRDHETRALGYCWGGTAASLAGSEPAQWQRVSTAPDPQLTNWLSALDSAHSRSTSREFTGDNVHVLRGPDSPLSMRIGAVAHALHYHSVCIDGDSVNTVLLDTRPDTVFQRLVVAASLTPASSNSSGPTSGRVRATATSLMPTIPGLPMLLALIFAPQVELRVDAQRGYIVGALCGLGYTMPPADEQGEARAVFEDDDVEVSADVVFSTTDLRDINLLRAIFWMMYLHPAAPGAGDPDDPGSGGGLLLESERSVLENQQRLRRVLLQLLMRRREPLNTTGRRDDQQAAAARAAISSRRFVWRQTRSGDLLEPLVDDEMDPRLLAHLVHGSKAVWRAELGRMCDHVAQLKEHAVSDDSAGPRYCALCELTLASPHLLLQHINGAEHTDKLRRFHENYEEEDVDGKCGDAPIW